MDSPQNPKSARSWTAEELRKLPADRRNEILAGQAALAEAEYRKNPELTAFEAFGPDDLYGDSADTRLTESQKAELDRRLEALDANPMTWCLGNPLWST